MKETCNICFGSKIFSKTIHQEKTGKHESQLLIAAKTKYLKLFLVHCCYISALVFICFHLTKVVLRIFDLKKLLRVSCILWCYYLKCYSVVLKNGILSCFIITAKWIFLTIWLKSAKFHTHFGIGRYIFF